MPVVHYKIMNALEAHRATIENFCLRNGYSCDIVSSEGYISVFDVTGEMGIHSVVTILQQLGFLVDVEKIDWQIYSIYINGYLGVI